MSVYGLRVDVVLGPGRSCGMSAPQSPESPDAFGRLQGLLLNVSDLSQFLNQLARLATEVVDGEVSCGVTVRYDAHLLTVGSSDERAERLDETQYQVHSGPCLEALGTGEIVESRDLATEARWQPYTRLARGEGLRCSLSLPLTLEATTFGAMNVYGFDGPDVFTGPVRHQLEVFAAQASGALRLATRQLADAEIREQLEQALASRTVIDQALGIIMGQQRCTADDAFALLRRQAQNNRRRLREVAVDLVTRTSGQSPQRSRPFEVD